MIHTRMRLTDKQLQMLKHADLVDMSHKARQKAAALLNDQGFAVLSIFVRRFFQECRHG